MAAGGGEPEESGGFLAAYLEGMPASLASARDVLADRPVASDDEPGRRRLISGGEVIAGAQPKDTICLGGVVITGDNAARSWVTIENGVITNISRRRPAGTRVVETQGVIVPGLMDLHGHPEFNVFAPWEPPKTYLNRYAWRADDLYKALIRKPQDELRAKKLAAAELRYAEIRALVSGVTAIQGASFQVQRSNESLVRNLDGVIFDEHHARATVDLPSGLDSPRGGPEFANIVVAIAAGEVNAHYVHLAEGQRSNQRSIDEFAHLRDDLGGLTAATVIIHGTALTHDQWAEVAAVGAKLVWSPQSNLRLYRETTRIADALDAGVRVGLGADWLPSGSTSLLAEMKVARQELSNQGHPITAAELVAMVTSEAALIAGLQDQLGTIRVGAPADLTVFVRRDDDPYESICAATPNDVELVLIGGQLCYGRSDWINTLAQDPATPVLEAVLAWGRAMLLNTGHSPDLAQPGGDLDQLRSSLINAYPQIGPIWA
jgi:cytosine/adenosine deaminase-related metal-dependent hydrolase